MRKPATAILLSAFGHIAVLAVILAVTTGCAISDDNVSGERIPFDNTAIVIPPKLFCSSVEGVEQFVAFWEKEEIESALYESAARDECWPIISVLEGGPHGGSTIKDIWTPEGPAEIVEVRIIGIQTVRDYFEGNPVVYRLERSEIRYTLRLGNGHSI